MSKSKAIFFTALSFLVTRHAFTARGVRVTLCGFISFTVPYDRIAICETKTSHYRCRLSSVASEETKRRVFIRTHTGFCIAIRPPDVDVFVETLQGHAPHIHARTLKETFRQFPSAA